MGTISATCIFGICVILACGCGSPKHEVASKPDAKEPLLCVVEGVVVTYYVTGPDMEVANSFIAYLLTKESLPPSGGEEDRHDPEYYIYYYADPGDRKKGAASHDSRKPVHTVILDVEGKVIQVDYRTEVAADKRTRQLFHALLEAARKHPTKW